MFPVNSLQTRERQELSENQIPNWPFNLVNANFLQKCSGSYSFYNQNISSYMNN